MNPSFQFILAGTKGETRVRILKVLDEQAQDTPQLAESLAVNQPKLDHHLTTLQENGLIEKRSADPDAPYHITRQMRADWDDLEELIKRAERPATPMLGIFVV